MACGRAIVWLPVIAHGDAGQTYGFGGLGITGTRTHLVHLRVRAVLAARPIKKSWSRAYAIQTDGQRAAFYGRCRPGYALAMGASRRAEYEGHEVRLRHRPMRRV